MSNLNSSENPQADSPGEHVPCPPRSLLCDVLSGKYPDELSAALIAHLERCPLCGRILEELANQIRDPIGDLLRRSSHSSDPFAVEAPCKDVVRHIAQGKLQLRRAHENAPLRFGKYRVEETLGQGGMGIVFRAINTETGSPVALKLLKTYLPHDIQLYKRFRRECRALGQLQHPHLVAARDSGSMDGTPYLIMELVEGVNLASVLKSHGPLSVENTCEVARQALIGLEFAWERGIVHRDIKPSNLMLTRDPHGNPLIKILDLGLLRLLAHAQSNDESILSLTGQIVGTRAYMSPEQSVDSRNVDHRTDIYSLGATMLELLTGRLGGIPFSILESQPSSIRSLLSRLTASDRDQRVADGPAIRNELAPWASDHRLAELLVSMGH